MKTTIRSLLFVVVMAAFPLVTLRATVEPDKKAPPIPNVPLVNAEGKPFQIHDLKGSYIWLTFIFSRCPMPKMCPLTMTKSKSLLREWKKAGISTPLKVVAITLDPEFDTPAVLKKFGNAHGIDPKNFILATGAPQALQTFGENFNIIGVPEQGTISHNMKNILIGPDLVELYQFKDNEWADEKVIKVALGKKLD